MVLLRSNFPFPSMSFLHNQVDTSVYREQFFLFVEKSVQPSNQGKYCLWGETNDIEITLAGISTWQEDPGGCLT